MQNRFWMFLRPKPQKKISTNNNFRNSVINPYKHFNKIVNTSAAYFHYLTFVKMQKPSLAPSTQNQKKHQYKVLRQHTSNKPFNFKQIICLCVLLCLFGSIGCGMVYHGPSMTKQIRGCCGFCKQQARR